MILKTATFADVSEAFASALASLFERWEDEHAHEATEFAAHFQTKIGDRLGAKIDRVSGTARRMRIDLTFADCRRVVTATLGANDTLAIDVRKGPRRDR